MSKIAIAVHGGAGPGSVLLRKNKKSYEDGLALATEEGYRILKKGGSALDAVEVAVKCLENNALFNAGKGSTLNCLGEVEMDAAIMNGKNRKAGAVSMVRNVKNPIELARIVMQKTNHVFLSGYGALAVAKKEGVALESESYFITEYELALYKALHKKESLETILKKKMLGTVGAVALDKRGNLAAGTSTGGTSNCLPGRIGDSCVIGAGCYANNATCALSGTGEGETLITGVIGNTVSLMMELKNLSIQEACDYVVHTRNKKYKGHIGVIAVNGQGEFGMAYNTAIMKRAWKSSDEALQVKI
ncbi:MAG: isoaspartyl peptidase/L-asparaginase [Tatlockia sp.]|jgi:beta-aspartyl-peptidase (threonine type)